MTGLIDDIDPLDLEVTVRLTASDVRILTSLCTMLDKDNDEVFIELLRRSQPSANGHGFQAICDHCQLPYTAFHRPKPDVKHYCSRPECKREAAADRARRYRDRKSGGKK